MALEFGLAGFFNQSACCCRTQRKKTVEWKKNAEKYTRECFGQREYEVQGSSPTTALLPTPTPARVMGELGHKRAECALNNHNKNPSSPLWKRTLMLYASLTVPVLINIDRKQIRDFYTRIWCLVIASQNMFGKRLRSDQLHSFPIFLEL